MDSLIETFHIDWKLMVAQAVNFAVVIAVLYWFALRPLSKLMGERKQEIEKGLTDAKTNAETLKETQKNYDEALSKARTEANSIVMQAKKDAEQEKARILAESKSQADAMIDAGKKELEAQKQKTIDEAKIELARIVVLSTEKVLEGVMHSPIEGELINKSIKEVTS